MAEPGISLRLADLVTDKQLNSQAKLNSLASAILQEKTVLSEDALGVVERPVNNPRGYKYEEVDKRT